MPTVIFDIDRLACLYLLLLIILLFLFWRWGRAFAPPQLLFSSLVDFQGKTPKWRERLSDIPRKLLIFSFALFALAFTDPHLLVKKTAEKGAPLKHASVPTEGIAIYFVLDQSGSMKEKVEGNQSKVDILKKFTTDFIKGNPSLDLPGRPNDLIGLVFFARVPQIIAPLTLDHEDILKQLANFDAVKKEDEDGTAIGYALFKTINLIAATREYAENLPHNETPPYKIKSAILILVTDGFQSPSPLDRGRRFRNIDLDEAAEYAKQHGVKIYIVNVEPRLATEEFAPYRKLMQKSAAISGGRFFVAESPGSLDKIYAEIDRLEKSALPIEEGSAIPKSEMRHFYKQVPFYPYLVGLGMGFLFIAVILAGTLLRRVP